MLRIDHVEKSFLLNGERITVLRDISLRVAEGEFVALLGPSGCGKSTLLSLLAGYYAADAGSIAVNGRIGYMPQRDMLLPWLSVAENAVLPVAVRDKAGLTAARRQVRELLPLFGLEGFGNSLPDQLSGGMRQRAALLRTYMMGGQLWLLDEPFGKLDALTKEALQNWLADIIARLKPGVLFVTHDIDEAIKLASRIYLLSARPGRLIGDWAVEHNASVQARADLKQQIWQALEPC